MEDKFEIPLNGIDGIYKSLIEEGFGDIILAALNTGNGLMQQRIFRDNLDTKNNNFGSYIGEKKNLTDYQKQRLLSSTKSKTDLVRIKKNLNLSLTQYERKRVNKGRQIAKKDLEFTGDLRKSIEIQVKSENEGVIEFRTEQAALIARGQENQITNIRNGIKGTTKGDGIKIFTLNESERLQVTEQVKLLIDEMFKR